MTARDYLESTANTGHGFTRYKVPMITGLAMALLQLTACGGDSPTMPAPGTDPSASVVSTDTVADLAVTQSSGSAITVRWTEVDDGTGAPADYRLRYSDDVLVDWNQAELGCDRQGAQIGMDMSCTVAHLESATSYEFQLTSYRIEDDSLAGAVHSNVATGTTTAPEAGASGTVQDLTIAASDTSTLTVRWTQIDDGAGEPASYRLKYANPPIDWSAATLGCEFVGDEIGAEASCTIEGLESGTTYDVQLMSYRVAEGAWESGMPSNVTTEETAEKPTVHPSASSGVWISAAEIMELPTSGAAWNNVLSEANSSCGSVDLTDQVQRTNVCIMAKALVFVRTGKAGYRSDVLTAIRQIVAAPSYSGRALAMGRELGAYVISADLIDLENHDPALDEDFRSTLRTLRTAYTSGAASSLIDCHERRPNNWGSHCGATRAAIAVYLDDADDLARTAQVFKGYLGDRSSYSGFRYGGGVNDQDLSWQCDPERPVGINPAGCVRDGLSLDGALPDDQRRGGSFTTSPPKENYVWEALQGLLAQAVILHRAGYPVWEWEDRALLRAVRWLHDVVDYPAEGDDIWQPHIVNRYYGTSFPAPVPTNPGKNVGWTDWTHR